MSLDCFNNPSLTPRSGPGHLGLNRNIVNKTKCQLLRQRSAHTQTWRHRDSEQACGILCLCPVYNINNEQKGKQMYRELQDLDSCVRCRTQDTSTTHCTQLQTFPFSPDSPDLISLYPHSSFHSISRSGTNARCRAPLQHHTEDSEDLNHSIVHFMLML